MKPPKNTPASKTPIPRERERSTGQSPARLNTLLNLLARLQRFAWDVGGVLILAFSLMTLLAILAPELTQGQFLRWWRGFLQIWLGWGSFLVVLAGAVIGLLLLRRPTQPGAVTASSGLNRGMPDPLNRIPWRRIFVLEIAGFAFLTLLAVMGGNSLERAEAGLDGGQIGWGLAEILRLLSGLIGLSDKFWQVLFSGGILVLCLLFGIGAARPIVRRLKRWAEPTQPKMVNGEPAVVVASAGPAETAASTLASPGRKRSALPVEFRKRFRMTPVEEKNTPPLPRDDRLPPLELLVSEQGYHPDERNINLTAGLIEKTLAEFGIPAKVIGFRVGPTVTQFAVEPGFLEKTTTEEDSVRTKVRVSQIASLRRDLTLALAAERLRIEAPVPGRPYVGIEVPNVRTSIVRLRPILESEIFYKISSPLAIALGRDVSGQPVVADLTRMPHLLIAGTTGSGKSVCIAALTTCLVMNNSPSDLRLVMIDPKMVELVRFNGLPHLYGRVETDIQRILGVLRWVVVEMDRRYKLLEEMHARDLDAYNRKVHRRKGLEPLPRIVVMVDELADLMMSAPDQTEHTLVRLAQMARATGIHLVVATQRPSTDVVTGLIKANFPARISFAVAAGVDSRVILDSTGAESLLGHGDMLFLPPEAPAPMRCQGVMISDQEVEKVITFWQKSYIPTEEAEEGPPWEMMLEAEAVLADRDDLVTRAIDIVRQSQRASASMLQRRLRIGYPRAARLMDELEDLGIVGPSQGGGREREVIIEPGDASFQLDTEEDESGDYAG